MKRKRITLPACILCLVLLMAAPSVAADSVLPVTSADLINQSAQYDGQPIVYEGEIIGDIMDRGEHFWMNVADAAGVIGIWVNASLLPDPDTMIAGSYKTTGDRYRITGVFHRSCAEHGGDLDIHADSARLLAAGQPVAHPVRVSRLAVGISLFSFVLTGSIFTVARLRKPARF